MTSSDLQRQHEQRLAELEREREQSAQWYPDANRPTVETKVPVTLQEAYRGCEKAVALRDGRNIMLRVPPGVDNSTVISVRGEDNTALVGVEVVLHRYFRRYDNDVHLTIQVPVVQCLTGGPAYLEGLRGREVIQLPARTKDGQMFRVRDGGMPILNTPDQYGDLIVMVKHANDLSVIQR